EKTDPLRVPRYDISVAETIIEKACQRNSRHCMIAEAIKEQIPGAINVVVDMMTIRFSIPEKGFRYTFHTPPLAQDALARFDRGIAVDPFTVRLKNGHATSMVKHVRETDGPRIKKTKVHNGLGTPKIKVEKASNGGIETEIVGGKPPPVLKPKHGSHSSIRVFGVRNWTEGWEHVSERQDAAESPTNT